MTAKHTIGVLTLVCLASASAMADNLGVANAFNGFILGNSSETSDVMGRYAVGGDANVNLSIASHLAANSDLNLIVGGNFTMSANTVNGSAFVGGNAHWNTPTISGNLAVNGTAATSGGTINGNVTYGTSANLGSTTIGGTVSQGTTSSPIDFAAAATELQTKSLSWSALSANGSANRSYSTLNLVGTDAAFNVINVTETQFSGISTFNLTAPTGSTVLVNIAGTSDAWHGGLSLSGVNANHVIYNFYQATSLSLSGIGVEGSVLAPLASVSASGQLNGTLVAGSLSGSIELHDKLFQGDVQAVPEPASFLALLPALGLLIKRRSQKF